MTLPTDNNSEGNGPEVAARTEEFVRLFALNHQRLLAYILAFVHDRTSADEVFQETSLILWREFPSFRREAPFMPWACGIAFNQLRKFWRQRKNEKLTFSVPLLEELAKESVEMEDELEARRAALGECLKRLPEEDRQLVQQYYSIKSTAQDLAEKLGKSVHTIYKALNRTRRRLFDCIARRMAAQQR